MEQAFLLQGLEAISEYFGERWKPESVKAVMADLLKEPDAALINAHARVYAEMNPRPFPPIARIADIIKDEGRKHRTAQAKEREYAWRREKGEDATGRVDGNPLKHAARRSELAKRCVMYVSAYREMSDDERLEFYRVMDAAYPGMHFDRAGMWLKRYAETGRWPTSAEIDRH